MATAQEKRRNPAESDLSLPKDYRPLASKQLRLETPEIPGHTLHWFSDRDPRRIPDARRAMWEFVDAERDGIDINNFDLAGDAKAAGSTDLGSRISVGGGGYARDGRQARLYLMKCKNEYVELDKQFRAEQAERVAQSLRQGNVGVNDSAYEASKRYVGEASSPLFNRK